MRLSARPPHGPGGLLGVLLVTLAMSGLAFWFIIGLPWGPHNESFDWVVRLETRTLWGALFSNFPSVLSLRPLGTGAAWLLYRLGGHDPGLAEIVNALLALFAWGWAASGAREQRLFAVLALVASGVFFAGYIWVFHLHGIFYGPLLVYLAALVRSARGPLDLRTLLGVFVGALVTALVHPYALPLAVTFVLGATLETPLLRSRQGVSAVGLVVFGVAAAYLLLVPSYNRGVAGDPWTGWFTSFATIEVSVVGSLVAGGLAAWTASRAWPGPPGLLAALLTLVLAAIGVAMHAPVLPLWIAWAAAKSVRHGRFTMAALLGATALLPMANPTGSPTYAIFAVFVAVCASAYDEQGSDSLLHAFRPVHVGGVLALMLAVAVMLRSGVPVPVLSRIAQPLFVEGERTRQLELLGEKLVASPWREHPVRLLRSAVNPTESDATDRRFRPPTEDAHLATWLDWKRGTPPAATDTLVLTFGGETVAGMDTVLLARGRYAGDALVLRRSPAAMTPDTLVRMRP